ncbi:MAG: hypothetical protein FJZ92_08280 [Chloroflexi bacterium]|nr:hypothetical protein [Chloroflexota bacterium]
MTDPDPLVHVDPWVALHEGRSQLLRAIDGLAEAEAELAVEARGRWHVGDLLTHLASWDEMTAAFLQAIAGGTREFPVEARADDDWSAWNASRIAEARSADLAARLARLHAAREALVGAAGSLAGELLDVVIAAPWDAEDTLRAYLVGQAMHDGAHAVAIAQARARGSR